MTLPINSSLSYDITIPSTKKKTKFRPFVVKEQKELMIAHQSEDTTVMINTLKNVIKSCLSKDIDVNKLAIFDIEYIFTQIRSKSSGEISELIFGCDEEACVDNEKARIKINIDLSQMKVDIPENHTNKIPLFDETGVVMKYPDIEVLNQLDGLDTETDMMFNIIVSSIELIYDKENIYKIEDYTKEEIVEFLDNLSIDSFKGIITFFDTMPKLTYEVKYKCPVCSKEHQQVIEGLSSFF